MQKILSGYCHIANISDQNTTSAKRINQGFNQVVQQVVLMWSGITSGSTRGQPRINQGSKKDQPGILMWIQGLHETENFLVDFLVDHCLVHSKIWPDAVNIRYISMELVPRLSWSFDSSSIWPCIVGWIFVGAATWICDCMLRIAAALANTISCVT